MCVLFYLHWRIIFQISVGHYEIQHLPRLMRKKKRLTASVIFMHFLANFHLNMKRVKTGSLYLAMDTIQIFSDHLALNVCFISHGKQVQREKCPNNTRLPQAGESLCNLDLVFPWECESDFCYKSIRIEYTLKPWSSYPLLHKSLRLSGRGGQEVHTKDASILMEVMMESTSTCMELTMKNVHENGTKMALPIM